MSPELLINIFLALCGGLLMNFMPCVLPLISLKISGFLKSSHNKREFVIKNLAYIGGVLSCFFVLSITLLLFRLAGHQIMFGQHMQSGLFLLVIFIILLLIGFNFSGLFEVNLDSTANEANKVLKRYSGLMNNYLNGILASILAIPCTAPFIATALTYALTTNNFNLVVIIFTMGVGFALPFIAAIFLSSKALALIPKPGAWMVKFKEIMAFPIYGSAFWILYVLIKQKNDQYAALCLIIGLILYFIFWFQKNFQSLKNIYKIVIYLSVISLGYFVIPENNIVIEQQAFIKEDFSYEKLNKALRGGRKIMVVASASWCLTCSVNEKNALSSEEFKKLIVENNILYLYADFTDNNIEGLKFLHEYKHIGIPFYVLFDSKGKSEILPQILTKDLVINKLKLIK